MTDYDYEKEVNELIKYIVERMELLDIDTFMYFYNDVCINVLNDGDRSIYTIDELEYNILNNMFSNLVTDNLLRNILYGNANVNNDYFYWDSYLHLQSISYYDAKQDFISELKDEVTYDYDMLEEIRVYIDSYT